MSFIGAMGVVAQQGNQGGVAAPTSVSIASSAPAGSGYDNAISSDSTSLGSFFEVEESEFSNTYAVTYTIDPGELAIAAEQAGGVTTITQKYKGYIRATGATSFLWGLQISGGTLSNGTSATISGTASTDQDETSNSTGDIGKYFTFNAGGGRGGVTWPANNDTIDLEFDADATNSGGTTAASTITVTYDFET